MRSRNRQRQEVYFVSVTESLSGINTVKTYGKPTKRKLYVSETQGDPQIIGSGLVITYGRYIVCYSSQDLFAIGTQVFVDALPDLDSGGNLTIDSPLPDYVIVRVESTKKGRAFRMWIRRIEDSGETYGD